MTVKYAEMCISVPPLLLGRVTVGSLWSVSFYVVARRKKNRRMPCRPLHEYAQICIDVCINVHESMHKYTWIYA